MIPVVLELPFAGRKQAVCNRSAAQRAIFCMLAPRGLGAPEETLTGVNFHATPRESTAGIS
jgi:hypothetical protein